MTKRYELHWLTFSPRKIVHLSITGIIYTQKFIIIVFSQFMAFLWAFFSVFFTSFLWWIFFRRFLTCLVWEKSTWSPSSSCSSSQTSGATLENHIRHLIDLWLQYSSPIPPLYFTKKKTPVEMAENFLCEKPLKENYVIPCHIRIVFLLVILFPLASSLFPESFFILLIE